YFHVTGVQTCALPICRCLLVARTAPARAFGGRGFPRLGKRAARAVRLAAAVDGGVDDLVAAGRAGRHAIVRVVLFRRFVRRARFVPLEISDDHFTRTRYAAAHLDEALARPRCGAVESRRKLGRPGAEVDELRRAIRNIAVNADGSDRDRRECCEAHDATADPARPAAERALSLRRAAARDVHG